MSPIDYHTAPISRTTPITETYRNTRNVRRCFRTECGSHFEFDRPFIAWIKSGAPKTMGGAANEWLRLARNDTP